MKGRNTGSSCRGSESASGSGFGVPFACARGQDSVKSLMTQAGYSLKMPKKATSFRLLALAYIFCPQNLLDFRYPGW